MHCAASAQPCTGRSSKRNANYYSTPARLGVPTRFCRSSHHSPTFPRTHRRPAATFISVQSTCKDSDLCNELAMSNYLASTDFLFAFFTWWIRTIWTSLALWIWTPEPHLATCPCLLPWLLGTTIRYTPVCFSFVKVINTSTVLIFYWCQNSDVVLARLGGGGGAQFCVEHWTRTNLISAPRPGCCCCCPDNWSIDGVKILITSGPRLVRIRSIFCDTNPLLLVLKDKNL